MMGLGLLIAADLALALLPGWAGLALGVVVWGCIWASPKASSVP